MRGRNRAAEILQNLCLTLHKTFIYGGPFLEFTTLTQWQFLEKGHLNVVFKLIFWAGEIWEHAAKSHEITDELELKLKHADLINQWNENSKIKSGEGVIASLKLKLPKMFWMSMGSSWTYQNFKKYIGIFIIKIDNQVRRGLTPVCETFLRY